jgi:hypothetical protein
LALGPCDLGLIRFQRIADRGADVSLSGSLISTLCRTISGVSRAVGLVAIVVAAHRTKAYPGAEAIPSVRVILRPLGGFDDAFQRADRGNAARALERHRYCRKRAADPPGRRRIRL